MADGECCLSLGFLGADADVVALIGAHFKVAPLQFEYIADAKSSHTSKERCLFQYRNTARGGSELLNLVKCQILLFNLFLLDFFKKVIEVFAQHLLLVGDFQKSAEGRVISRC